MEEDIKQIKKTISRIESDLSFDRSDLQNLDARLTNIESLVKRVVDRQPRLENKLSDAVQDALEPLVGAVSSSTKKPGNSLLKAIRKWLEGVKGNEK